jgi:hypothetical protein
MLNWKLCPPQYPSLMLIPACFTTMINNRGGRHGVCVDGITYSRSVHHNVMVRVHCAAFGNEQHRALFLEGTCRHIKGANSINSCVRVRSQIDLQFLTEFVYQIVAYFHTLRVIVISQLSVVWWCLLGGATPQTNCRVSCPENMICGDDGARVVP